MDETVLQTNTIDKETFKTFANINSYAIIFYSHDGIYKQAWLWEVSPMPHLANDWLSLFDKTIQGGTKLHSKNTWMMCYAL